MIRLLPTPLWPTTIRFSRRPMNSAVANASIRTRSMVAALNCQSKSTSVLPSRNPASRIRCAMLRSRRRSACSLISSRTNSRCDKPSRSARDSTASNRSGRRGIRRVSKCSRICWRSSAGAGIDGAAGLRVRVVIAARLLVAEMSVIRPGPGGHRDVVVPGGDLSSLLFGQGLPAALGTRLDREDALDGRVRIRAVTDGPLQRGDQVLTRVRPQQGQHPLRLVLAVTLGLQQALQELTARHSQFPESFLQLRLALPRVLGGAMLLLFAAPPDGRARQQRMSGD